MSLSAKLQQRQTQTLAMTPQLAQSIKLLQFSHLELQAFVKEEIEKNPLLELAADIQKPDSQESIPQPLETVSNTVDKSPNSQPEASLENVYDTGTAGAERQALDAPQPPSSGNETRSSGSANLENLDFISNLGETPDLVKHLEHQIMLEFKGEEEQKVATYIAHGLDEDGYFREPLPEAASTNQTSIDMVQWVLERFQSFEPVGVGARNLGECLELQLRDQNRFDPAMDTLLRNLPLLAKREFSTLQKLCGVTKDDFTDMLSEIRALDPRPARSFEPAVAEVVVPDILVNRMQSGNWSIELNPQTLPKVLLDKDYHAELTNTLTDEEGLKFVSTCMENANWLIKSLDQRAQTILKVATEIVKQQDRFFADGVQYLKPMTLKQVAEKIKMHESTVSRVTSNKYLICDQGTFELKYFFSSAIASSDGTADVSAEAVKHQIQQMINAENPGKILSDEQIVSNLQDTGIAIARRTVAKYREAMHIPSSVERRRQKANVI